MSALNGQKASSLNLYGIEQETRIPLMLDKDRRFHEARGAGREVGDGNPWWKLWLAPPNQGVRLSTTTT